MMYFESRQQAGKLLAEQLVGKYRYENTVVVALNPGGVIVGQEIAAELHCLMTMLLSAAIEVPGEGLDIGSVSQDGGFSYNAELTLSEQTGFEGEYHGYFSEQRRVAFNKLNRLAGDDSLIDRDMIRDRVVILVADGFMDSLSVGVALDFLKPIRVERLVVAAPIASVDAVDKLHVSSDEIHVLDVKENFMGINHYFDNQPPPSDEEAVQIIQQTILQWK